MSVGGYLKQDLNPTGGGGGPAATYTNLTPVPVGHGGVATGENFTSQTMQQMFDRILYPSGAPTFSAFSIMAQASPLEVGASILANRTFVWTTTDSANVQPNSLVIRNETDAVDLATGLADDNTEAIATPVYTLNAPGSYLFSITGQSTTTVAFSRQYEVEWQYKRFYGEFGPAGPITEADIEGLRASELSDTFVGSYAFVAAASEYKYIAYPAALGTATNFDDHDTGFNVPMDAVYTVMVTNAFGAATLYNVHRTWNQMGGVVTIDVS